MNKHSLQANHLTAGYQGKVILSDVNLRIPRQKISVILGANGCGKSTLLRAMARLLRPVEGQILLDGKVIHTQPSKEVAKMLGLLPQTQVMPEGIRVSDLVARGRFPYCRLMRGMSRADFAAVQQAMERMGVAHLADRCVDELSGGQRQRVWIALALAQETDILLLDEPTTYLDIAYQVEILDMLADLNRQKKTTIVMVLHDINLSARYADYLFAMRDGRLEAQGRPEQIITEELMKSVYGLACSVVHDPISDSPMVLPIGKYHYGETAQFAAT